VGYSPLPIAAHPEDPVPSCVHARDLPLIAALGANTVRTYRLLPEGDTSFVALLDTTGLHWLAGFPLEPYYGPAQPISAKRDAILDGFRKYAERFRGERHLIAYVFGNDVPEDYNRKFAGPVSDFYALLGDVAILLRELEPENTPLLATGVRDLADLRNAPPGLSFWLWNAGSVRYLTAPLEEIRRRSAKPVLAADYGVGAFNQFAGREDEAAQAQAAVGLVKEIESAGFLLGGVYAALADDYRDAARLGLFQPVAAAQPGLDTLRPRAVYGALAALWGGRAPAEWRLENAPQMQKVAHAASDADVVSPGALVRVTGKTLAGSEFVANGIPWPLHLGESCLCIGDEPVPLGMLSPESITAQVPWDLAPGEQAAVLFRAGASSNLVKTQVRQYAPGIFPGAVVRAGTFCRVSAENGVRPGEILEVYATGLGPGAPSLVTPTVSINGTSAGVLYSGLLSSFTGLNQVNVRVNPLTPPSQSSAFELRVEEASSNLYPISVARAEDRFGVLLRVPPSELVLQAGGPGGVVEVEAEGVNGYCGPVLFSTGESPYGISFRAPVAFTGQTTPLEVTAAPNAWPQTGAAMVLYGYAAGAQSGAATLRVTILPSRGDLKVRVVSGGYKSSPLARFDWNGRVIYSTAGGGPGRGINVLVVDPVTGVFSPVASFDTWGDVTASQRLVGHLSGLPPGAVVLFAVADDGSLLLTSTARDAIASMFGSRLITALSYQQSWAMIGRKGASPIAEGASATSQVVFERVLTFPL
jgi:uncharacterized protein (TIGR03437 family)